MIVSDKKRPLRRTQTHHVDDDDVDDDDDDDDDDEENVDVVARDADAENEDAAATEWSLELRFESYLGQEHFGKVADDQSPDC